MKLQKKYNQIRARRKNRVRRKVMKGTSAVPRLSLFRSNKHLFAQLIDDEQGKTLVAVSSQRGEKEKGTKTEIAKHLGELLGTAATQKKIIKAVVDRGSYKYHGRIKAFVEGARKGGLKI